MTKLLKIKPHKFINPDMQDLYDSVEEHLDQLQQPDFLRGIKYEDLDLGTTSVLKAHGLGKEYTGFFVLNINNDAVVYTEDLPKADKKDYIMLKANKSTTATIWVF